ncbi:tape measure protein [Paracoccus kondratievae]|uniref:tape measure protein n=1 Tax=Paracoccus kondratievae TaxID=135740 RepID=UPI0012662E8B|nr:tape measure protein [Paracoccus kondratievae]QFQ87314.1 tape measure protein [Paracoccus kondratievae]
MAEADAGLELPIGLTEQKFMQQLARIEARAIRTAQKMERDFARSNAGIARASGEVGRQLDSVFTRLSRGASTSFAGMRSGALGAVAGVTALLASMAKLGKYAQDYRQVENRLRSLGEYSDDAAERLTEAAIRSRTGLRDMADGVARIQKATGAGFDETIRRVETLNKLLTMGGASGAEVGSVMLQLSQALSSGVLQGDELRSLREAAPVELLDAIAKAAGGTRDQLKQMGEEGRLTSAVITQALDDMAAKADAGFARMAPTMADGWTNINSALTTFIGRADEGLGATAALAQGMMDLSTWLSSNADLAEEIGISVQAALGTFSEYAQKAIEALGQLSDFLNTTVREAIYGPGDAFAAAGITAGEAIGAIIDALAVMNGALEGAADAVTEAFLKIPDAITGALQSAINAVISAVETMVNTVLSGVRGVAAQVDALTGAVASLTGGSGTNLAGGIGTVSLPRATDLATSYSSRSVSDAYNSGYDRGSGTVYAAADAVEGFFDGITENYERRKSDLKAAAEEADKTPDGVTRPQPPAQSENGSGGPSKKTGRGRKRGAGRGKGEPTFSDIIEDASRDITNLERQIQLVGKSAEETARLRAQWEMLDAAKKAGIPVNAEVNARIEAQAAQVGQLTAELERAELAQEQFDQAIDGIADAFAGALVAGESLRDGLAQVLKQIAADIINSGIRNALMGQFGSAGGGGGGFFSSLFGGLFGGFRAAGGPVDPGRAYVVGEKGPELIVPKSAGMVIPNHKLRGGGGGSSSVSLTVDLRGTTGDRELDAKIASAGRAILAQVPQAMSEAQKRRPGPWGA